YVGKEWPGRTRNAEIVDCAENVAVPGYIEPHVHPFQLYNPLTFAEYASVRGTTTMICDSLTLFLSMAKEKAFTIIDRFSDLPVSMFWWGRYDAQTELSTKNDIFSTENVHALLNHPSV